MKQNEFLEIMGEINEKYIEDAAAHVGKSPRSILMRLGRPAGIAAAAGLIGFTVLVVGGVIRDGIAQQNPPEWSNTAANAPEQDSTAAESETEETKSTLPADLFVEVTNTTAPVAAAETTVTTTTEPIPPALQDFYDDEGNIIYPDASWEQEIGDTFRFTYFDRSGEGVMAVTVNSAQCYDSLEAAGIAYEDLCESFLDGYYYAQGYFSGDEWEGETIQKRDMNDVYEKFRPLQKADIERDYADYNFIKINVTVQNINSVSVYPEIRRTYFSDYMDGDYDETDDGIGRLYDFNARNLCVGVIPNPDYESEKHPANYVNMWSSGICYFSGKNSEYDSDEFERDSWFYLEPGDALTFEVGGFVPKYYYKDVLNRELFFEEGTDLKPYYFFGTPSLYAPHALLRF